MATAVGRESVELAVRVFCSTPLLLNSSRLLPLKFATQMLPRASAATSTGPAMPVLTVADRPPMELSFRTLFAPVLATQILPLPSIEIPCAPENVAGVPPIPSTLPVGPNREIAEPVSLVTHASPMESIATP